MRVVAIDRSYSMGAPGVFARALELARQAVDEAPGGERIAVVAFDDRADVLAVPGGRAEARAALDGLAAGFGATRYGPVFQQAADVAAGAIGRVVVITDLQRVGWEGEPTASVPAGWSLEVREVATAGDSGQNLAVSGVTVEVDRLVAAIRNDGAASRAGRVRVTHEGQQVATAEYTAAPGTTTDVPIAWRVPESGAISVAVDDSDGLPADNATVRRARITRHAEGARHRGWSGLVPLAGARSRQRRSGGGRAASAGRDPGGGSSSPALAAWSCSRPVASSAPRASG